LWKIIWDKSTPEQQRKFNRTILNQFMMQGIKGNPGLKMRAEDTHPTCGVCQAVCVADPKQRKELLNLLRNSGVMYVDDQFKEYFKRVDETGKEVIHYPMSEEEWYQKAK
jgi:hypothetical protein